MACSSCSSGGGCGTKPGGCKSNGGCSTGGCNRLNVFDWLQDVEVPDSFAGFDIVEVRFKGGRKEFMRNDQRLPLVTGDAVVVDAAGSGWHLGHVSLKGELVRLQMRKKKVPTDSKEIRNILRIATPEDVERWEAVRDLENGTMFRARAMVGELRLRMKLSDVEYQADRTRALFYYSAEDRVDFRELIRRLADEFRVRVEMRQISLRQEAGRIGGIGVCGRELCCSTWLQDFKTVSTTAARYQNLSLNPQKLAGQCGRLKCCLNYELDAYLDALKDIPQVQRPLKTSKGEAFLQKTDIFRRRMWFAFKGDNNWVMLDTARVRELLEMNKRGEVIESLLPPREEAPEPEVSAIVEGNLDRLDDKIKSGSKRPKRKKSRGEADAESRAPREGREPREPRAAAEGTAAPREARPPREPREAREGRVPRDGRRPAGAAPGGPRPPEQMTSPGPGDIDNPVPALGDVPEQRGRRGAAARPLNRRNGRGRSDAPRPEGEAGEPRPDGGRNRRSDSTRRPDANATPRPAAEGGGEARPRREAGGGERRAEGGERREGRGGRNNRRGGRGPASDGSAAPAPAPAPAGS
ncbi:regulatory iron-sulfur-containing complex subunit RicT [Hymenobacter sp. BT770]|uniref:PSP1 domain-containing protein n=1 Tax=Hymenobacter sp. BT770 TaxID=2886942 RepID=UPI001D12A6D4|nr:regulatory iron-sulfur-containing complex subunit RicT [Hymenobacter sp. BT770]MCC3153303.1 Signal peptidase-like protein [Hymenobacter sp. BT770]MDO3414298.1 regulatory iron-sulfur-containing complex subunit RicT [Hymenobacter sp. BT770]